MSLATMTPVMQDFPVGIVLEHTLPDAVPEELRTRHLELASRRKKLDAEFEELQDARESLHTADDPFAAVASWRTQVVTNWRGQARLWHDLSSLANSVEEALRHARIRLHGELQSARDAVRREHFAEHLEEPPDYHVADDATVKDLEYSKAQIDNAERRWRDGEQLSLREAVAIENSVKAIVRDYIGPVLSDA